MSKQENIRRLQKQAEYHRRQAEGHEECALQCEGRILDLLFDTRYPTTKVAGEMEALEIESKTWPDWMQEQLRMRQREREENRRCSKKGCERKAEYAVSDGACGLSPVVNYHRLCQAHLEASQGFKNVRKIQL